MNLGKETGRKGPEDCERQAGCPASGGRRYLSGDPGGIVKEGFMNGGSCGMDKVLGISSKGLSYFLIFFSSGSEIFMMEPSISV